MPTEPTIHSPAPRESAERGTAVVPTHSTNPITTTPAGAAMIATTATPVAPATIIGEQEGNANGKRTRVEESGAVDGLNASRGKVARQKGAGIGPDDPVTIDRILEKAKLMQVSRALQTRLQYARLKVEYGWTRNTLNEVEDMFKRDVQKQTRAAAAAREAAATLTAAANGSLYVSKPPLLGHDEQGRRRNSTGAEHSSSSYVPKTPSTPTRNNPHFTRVTTPESSTRRWPPAGASFSVPTPPAAAIDWDDDGDSEDGIPSAAQAAHTILMLSSPRHSTPTNRPHYDFTTRSPTPTPTMGASATGILPSDPDTPTRSTVFSWQHQPPGSMTPTPQRVMTAPPPPAFGPVEIHHHHVHLHHSPSTPTHPRYLDHSPTFPSPSPTALPQLNLRGPRMGSFSRDPKDPALASAATPSAALSAAPSLRWKHVGPTMFEESGAKQPPGGPGGPGQGLIPTTPPSISHPRSSASPVSSRSGGSSAAGSPPGAPSTYHHPPRPPPAPINDQFRITEFVSVNGAAVNRTPGARGKNSIAAVQAKERERQEKERLEREERERARREGREPVVKVEEGEDRRKDGREGKNKGRRRS